MIDLCVKHSQVGSWPGAAHRTTRGKPCLIQTVKAWPVDSLGLKSIQLDVSEKIPQVQFLPFSEVIHPTDILPRGQSHPARLSNPPGITCALVCVTVALTLFIQWRRFLPHQAARDARNILQPEPCTLTNTPLNNCH